MKWTLSRTIWGYSLFYQGDLVASANHPAALLGLPLRIMEVSPS